MGKQADTCTGLPHTRQGPVCRRTAETTLSIAQMTPAQALGLFVPTRVVCSLVPGLGALCAASPRAVEGWGAWGPGGAVLL